MDATRITPKRFVYIAILLLLSPVTAAAHGEGALTVIVDTDMALDDIRALALLVQSPDVDIAAVVTSDGASSPDAGARNVRVIMRMLSREDIPVAPGSPLEKEPPPWRGMSESLGWSGLAGTGNEGGIEESRKSAMDLILEESVEHEDGVIYVCLGPMTNLAEALLADPSLAGRITEVYYSGSVPSVEPMSWNTARDPRAARTVFELFLPVLSFQVGGADLISFDSGLLDSICGIDEPAAALVCDLHQDERVMDLVESGHFRCWDEMVILALLHPELCTDRPPAEWMDKRSITSLDRASAYTLYLGILRGEGGNGRDHRRPVVLRRYPVDPDMLRGDIRPIAATIIERYGVEEWNSAVIANEFHRHLGIYSLIGVKMGIRAREIMNAGIDDLRVISHAGSNPPLSCMCDGLQVATGASLGRGTISIDPQKAQPEAVFIKGSRRLQLKLKQGIRERIRSDIEETIGRNGALTPAYWSRIRELSLEYWLDMDRREIFDEEIDESSVR